MVDTGGGMWGGVARGITSGAQLTDNLLTSNQERGLRQKQDQRLDQQTQIALHQARAETLRGMLDDSNDQIAALAKSGAGDDQLTAAIQRKQSLSDQLYGANGAIVRATGGQVLEGVNTALSDANYAKNGQRPPDLQGLPQEQVDQRGYNMMSLIHHTPSALSNDIEHDDGTVPVQQHLDNIHQGMQAGNHAQVRDSAGHLLGQFASPYEPDDERHTPGLNLDYDRSQPHGHIQAAADAVGRIGVVHAAINNPNDPGAQQVRDMLARARANGAQGSVDFARQVLYMTGGVRGLAKTLGAPDESEQKFMFLQNHLYSANIAAGMKPEEAKAKSVKDAIDRIARDPMEVEMQRGKNEIEVAKIHGQATRDAAGIRAGATGRNSAYAQLQSINDDLSDPDLPPEQRASLEALRTSLEHRYDKGAGGGGGAKGHVEGERKDFADPKDNTGLRKIPFIWSVQKSQWVPEGQYKAPAQGGGAAPQGQGASPAAAGGGQRPPAVGDMMGGYIFTGGNPADRANWAPANGQ